MEGKIMSFGWVMWLAKMEGNGEGLNYLNDVQLLELTSRLCVWNGALENYVFGICKYWLYVMLNHVLIMFRTSAGYDISAGYKQGLTNTI
jgi:hypothetical protein